MTLTPTLTLAQLKRATCATHHRVRGDHGYLTLTLA